MHWITVCWRIFYVPSKCQKGSRLTSPLLGKPTHIKRCFATNLMLSSYRFSSLFYKLSSVYIGCFICCCQLYVKYVKISASFLERSKITLWEGVFLVAQLAHFIVPIHFGTVQSYCVVSSFILRRVVYTPANWSVAHLFSEQPVLLRCCPPSSLSYDDKPERAHLKDLRDRCCIRLWRHSGNKPARRRVCRLAIALLFSLP